MNEVGVVDVCSHIQAQGFREDRLSNLQRLAREEVAKGHHAIRLGLGRRLQCDAGGPRLCGLFGGELFLRLGLDEAGELFLGSGLFGLGGLGFEKLLVIVAAAVKESRETSKAARLGRTRGGLLLLLLFGVLSGPRHAFSLLDRPLV